MAARQFIENLLKNNKVVVFSKSYCPYCHMAKEVLNSIGVKYETIELDKMSGSPSGDSVQNELHALTGQRTVPNVFIDSKSIGGGSETKALHAQGKLVPLLKEAGAL